MSFSCGIVGLPNSGKSTIFNALTAQCVPSQPYPFCTIEPNVGLVPVPDERLKHLGSLLSHERLTPTTIEFIDIAGLIKDAHKGEGLGNRFLSHIRNVDAVAHVLRLFKAKHVPHVYEAVDAVRDMEIVETEILISDLQIVEERLDKLERLARVSKEKGAPEKEVLLKVKKVLEGGSFVSIDDLEEAEREIVRGWNLIATKPPGGKRISRKRRGHPSHTLRHIDASKFCFGATASPPPIRILPLALQRRADPVFNAPPPAGRLAHASGS